MNDVFRISHSRPHFSGRFSEAVQRVLASGYVVMGNEAAALEQDVAARLQLPHAVAADSGTSALMLAVRALKGTRPEFTVGIPAYVCSAVLHAVRAAGATPRFMDCSPDLRLDPERARAVASTLDAVVLVHPFGLIEPLVSEPWPCPVIEDIAQAAGGSLKGKPLGSYGDIAVASFYATKPWGGAYGGMVLSRDKGICNDILSMRYADGADASLVYAGNHQLSDVHAAMVRTRLTLADAERQRRRHVACLFDSWLEGAAASPIAHSVEDNCFRYIVCASGFAADVIDALRGKGVDACKPVSFLSRFVAEACPGAAKAMEICVSLPLLSNFSEKELQYMEGALKTCLS